MGKISKRNIGTVEPGTGIRYLHCTPQEAIRMSKTDYAFGLDLLRWGERFHRSSEADDFTHVATATTAGVQFLVSTVLEEQFISGRWSGGYDGSSGRRRYIKSKNFFLWDQLSWYNEDFIYSLFWVPEEPVSALEALALAVED